jgi:ribosomal protein S10
MTQITQLNEKQIFQQNKKYAYSVKIIGKTYDFKLLSFFTNTIKILATSFFNTKNISIIALPKQRKYMTVLRSPHIYKKSQEHFLLQTNKLTIYCFFKNQKTADLFHKTIQRITFPGIEISIESSYLQ